MRHFKDSHCPPIPKRTQLQISSHCKISIWCPDSNQSFLKAKHLYQAYKICSFHVDTKKEIWTVWKEITLSMSQNTQHYDELNKQSWNTPAVHTVSFSEPETWFKCLLVVVPSSLASLKSIFSENQTTTDNRRRGIIFKRKMYVCGMLSFSCLSNAIPCSLSHLNSSRNGFQI